MSMLFQWQMADPWTNHQRYSIISINAVKGLEILYPKFPPFQKKDVDWELWIFVCVFNFFLIWLRGILCFGDDLNYIIITVTVIVDSLSLLGWKKGFRLWVYPPLLTYHFLLILLCKYWAPTLTTKPVIQDPLPQTGYCSLLDENQESGFLTGTLEDGYTRRSLRTSLYSTHHIASHGRMRKDWSLNNSPFW